MYEGKTIRGQGQVVDGVDVHPARLICGLNQGHEASAGVASLAIHALVIALLILIGTNRSVRNVVRKEITLIAPDLSPYKSTTKNQGGGGGGNRSSTPPSKGRLPKLASKQFVPPMTTPNQDPKLVMEPTLVTQPDARIPRIDMDVLGDPLAKSSLASNGPGPGGGIGTGRGGGIGAGSGPGFGSGSGGNMGDEAYHIGGGVTAPTVSYKVEPEFSEEARRAKFQGIVVIFIVVDEHGNPQELKIIRPLGLGLDQKALEAVRQWRFNPGRKDGRPVAVQATIEVDFHLL